MLRIGVLLYQERRPQAAYASPREEERGEGDERAQAISAASASRFFVTSSSPSSGVGWVEHLRNPSIRRSTHPTSDRFHEIDRAGSYLAPLLSAEARLRGEGGCGSRSCLISTESSIC